MKNREDRIREFVKSLHCDIDIWDYICNDTDSITDFESMRDTIDDNGGFNVDVIYYSVAIKYLAENDPSLQESIGLANEYGCTTENINSELLASLLASQNARIGFEELRTEIEDFFEELQEQEETEGAE
jgi:hypothetical protein